MAKYDRYNMVEMLNRDLERAVKEASIDAIVSRQMKEFEAKIRPIVKEEVEQLSFKSIDQVQDVLGIRTDLRLYIQWSDDDKAKILENEYSVVKQTKTVVEK
jgi:hypothetical protein